MQQLGSRSSLSWRRCSGAATHERATAAAVMRTRSAPVALWRCSPCRRPQLPSARASSPSDSEFEGVPPGDEALQDALESTLRLQVQSETLKEGIRDGLRQKVDEARRIGEELQARLDEEFAIERFRNDLESRETLASAMDKFSALEEEIAAVRQQLEADRADLAAWERASAQARSKGLFFKSLYAAPADADADAAKANGGGGMQRQQQPGDGSGGGGDGSSAGAARFAGELRGSLDPEAAAAARRAAAKVAAPAAREVGSPLRLWLFGYMAAVLAAVVVQDLATAAPKASLDALYAALALVLGATALQERGALAARAEEAQAAAAAAAAAAQEERQRGE